MTKKIRKKLRSDSERSRMAPAKRHRGNAMEVVVKLYQDGVPDVVKAFESGAISERVLRAACDYLSKQSRQAPFLEELKNYLAVLRNDSAWRLPPVAGDRRPYKVQAVAKGTPYLHTPMTFLGLKKGDVCHIAFIEDERGRRLEVSV